MSQCSRCGAENPADAKFCSQCGNRLGEASSAETTATIQFGGPVKSEADDGVTLNEADAAAVEALPPGSALLVVLRGPGSGSRYLLDKDVVTTGRHPESDIFLDDITVSRDHAILVRRGSDYYLDDCGSLNGTYVNRRRIESHRLNDGDELQVGKYKLAFLSG
jgi:pSer/pThr/pTyr-binding forkhead associated (FHA) protein